MILWIQHLHTVLSAIEKALSPILLIAAFIGEFSLFYFGILKRNKRMIVSASLFLLFFLFCIAMGLYRCSSRYFLILLPGAILMAGFLFLLLKQRSKIAALIVGFGILVFQGYKNFRIDPQIRKHINYFQRINTENAARKAAVLLLDLKEEGRFFHYLTLPCFFLVNWDGRVCDTATPLRYWQRYLYVNDVVYLAFQPEVKHAFSVSDFPCDGICRVTLDHQEFKGRHKKKCVQFFRLDQANQHVDFPASATSQLPLLIDPGVSPTLRKAFQITSEWGVFWEAVRYWRDRTCHYSCERFPKYWTISMSGPKICTLRTENLDLRKPFDCYLEYSGSGPKPIEVRLVVEGGGIYRDFLVALLPFDDRNVKRSIKLSFYPEMNPEKKKTTIVINIRGGGDLRISRLAFDRPHNIVSEKR